MTDRGSNIENPCISQFLPLIGHHQVTVSIFECIGELKFDTARKHRTGIIQTDINGADSRIEPVALVPAEHSSNSTVVLTNPDEDCSPAVFRAFLDELLNKPEPELESLHAAEALRDLRIDAEA